MNASWERSAQTVGLAQYRSKNGLSSTRSGQRTAALAEELGILIDEEQAVAAYDDRSGIVHGAQIDLSQPTEYDRFVATVDALQSALRAATRKAIEDPSFGAVFAADDDIAARWPLRPRAAG